MYNAEMAKTATKEYNTLQLKALMHTADLMVQDITNHIKAFAENGLNFYIINDQSPVHNIPTVKSAVLAKLTDLGFDIEESHMKITITW